MTDYKIRTKNSQHGWKKQESRRKWHTIAVVFICALLFFAAINGVFKSSSFITSIKAPKWDGKASFAISINGEQPMVFVFQKDPKRIALLKIPKNIYFATGISDQPFFQIKDLNFEHDGEKFASTISKIIGTKVENYILGGNSLIIDGKNEEKIIEDFKSLHTPFKILMFGMGDDMSNTNITRIDAIRLWWQLKDLSVNNVKTVDLAHINKEDIDASESKVLGVDTATVSKNVGEFFQVMEIISENKHIEISNGSKNENAAFFATRFIESAGGKIVKVSQNANLVGKCLVITVENSYTSGYLANHFACDIKNAQNQQDKNLITLIIGDDFANEIFR